MPTDELSPSCLAAIEKWLESLPNRMPWQAQQNDVARRSLLSLVEAYPNLGGTLNEAILWLRIGQIDRPHDLVQVGTTSRDSYLHGVVHRLEGDYWNAKYWFRQIKDRELLAAIGGSISKRLKALSLFEQARAMKIVNENEQFDPSALVDACEKICKSTSTRPPASPHERLDFELIEQLGQAEWETLRVLCSPQSSAE
ncbi:MAG: hypothetical protein SGI77_05160 [Pirellulaceae bacterium]|nr:hypothetical protein [Pirellulaceae bacterium]